MWMDELARAWRVSPKWASFVRDVAAELERDPGDCHAWCELAMLFGDTHAPELALVVCLHARTLAGDQVRVRSHLALCLLDLGLGKAATSPVPLRALGDAARAARHALAIAVTRLAT